MQPPVTYCKILVATETRIGNHEEAILHPEYLAKATMFIIKVEFWSMSIENEY